MGGLGTSLLESHPGHQGQNNGSRLNDNSEELKADIKVSSSGTTFREADSESSSSFEDELM